MPEADRTVRPALAAAAEAQQAYAVYFETVLSAEWDAEEARKAALAAVTSVPSLVNRVLLQDAQIQRLETALTRSNVGEASERTVLTAAYRIEEMRQELEDRHERMLARIASLVDGIESGRLWGMHPYDITEVLVSIAIDEPDFADDDS